MNITFSVNIIDKRLKPEYDRGGFVENRAEYTFQVASHESTSCLNMAFSPAISEGYGTSLQAAFNECIDHLQSEIIDQYEKEVSNRNNK